MRENSNVVTGLMSPDLTKWRYEWPAGTVVGDWAPGVVPVSGVWVRIGLDGGKEPAAQLPDNANDSGK